MIKVTVKKAQPINVEALSGNFFKVQAIGEAVVRDSPNYEGPYEVTSSFENQILETKDKKLDKNVKIKEMPVAEVSNPAGGTTLIIG